MGEFSKVHQEQITAIFLQFFLFCIFFLGMNMKMQGNEFWPLREWFTRQEGGMQVYFFGICLHFPSG